MARKPNYNFEKRKKELDRKARKEGKREDRLRRREEKQQDTPGSADPSPRPPENVDPPSPDTDAPGA